MNKYELAEKISRVIPEITKKEVEQVIHTMLDILTQTIKTGGRVTFTGFGTFSAKQRIARVGINPQKPQEKVQIPTMKTAKFKPGKALKEALRGERDSI